MLASILVQVTGFLSEYLILDFVSSCHIFRQWNLTYDINAGKLELSSVSSALILAAGIGIIEALALFLGSGLFLKLMGVSPVCLDYDACSHFWPLQCRDYHFLIAFSF
jgi:hypothetical protein